MSETIHSPCLNPAYLNPEFLSGLSHHPHRHLKLFPIQHSNSSCGAHCHHSSSLSLRIRLCATLDGGGLCFCVSVRVFVQATNIQHWRTTKVTEVVLLSMLQEKKDGGFLIVHLWGAIQTTSPGSGFVDVVGLRREHGRGRGVGGA